MLKRTVSLGLFIAYILILSACNLAQENPESTATDINTITPFATINTATMTHTATATFIPSTQTATATSRESVQISNQSERSDCVASQANLPVYIVQAGDTLSNIASRANSTVAQLASLNCLPNTSYIIVGQRLIVPNAIIAPATSTPASQSNNPNPPQDPPNNDTSPINIDDIPYPPANSQGTIMLSDWTFNVDQNYIVEAETSITVTWQVPNDMPFTQVGFVAEPYVDDFRRPRTLIGVDTDLTNGTSIQWLAPPDTQTYIFAVGQVSGQSELVVSEIIQIGTEDSNQVADTLSLGFLSVSPVIASDSSLINMIEDGGSITLDWLGMGTIGYRSVAPVSFYYEDTAGNITLIGQDNDDNNGISINWQTPPNVSGRVYAEGLFMTTQYDLFRRVVIINGGQIHSLIED